MDLYERTIKKMNNLFMKILFVVLLQVIIVCMELTYRKICFPITFLGVFFSVFTSTSDSCKFLRISSFNINMYLAHLLTITATQCIQELLVYIRKPNFKVEEEAIIDE